MEDHKYIKDMAWRYEADFSIRKNLYKLVVTEHYTGHFENGEREVEISEKWEEVGIFGDEED